MRAGSLSDARVVAALRKYFVSVHIPMLQTGDLIADPRDRELLAAYNASFGRRYPGRRKGPFWGGVREVFFGPDGSLLTIFQTLYPRTPPKSERRPNDLKWHIEHARDGGSSNRHENQLRRAGRARPHAAVRLWFAEAGAALQHVHGRMPQDWKALADGTAPEVQAVQRLDPGFGKRMPGDVLRVSVRHDHRMYDGLTGVDHVSVGSLEPASKGEFVVPAELFRRMARAAIPRGSVEIRLEDASIEGEMHLITETTTERTLRGRIRGMLRLIPRLARERGRRAGKLRWARCRWEGEFAYDRVRRRFTRLVAVGCDGLIDNHAGPRDNGLDSKTIAAVRSGANQETLEESLGVTLQPYAVAVELVQE